MAREVQSRLRKILELALDSGGEGGLSKEVGHMMTISQPENWGSKQEEEESSLEEAYRDEPKPKYGSCEGIANGKPRRNEWRLQIVACILLAKSSEQS